MRIDLNDVLRMLPHRDPILLVEGAEVDEAGGRGRAWARLPANAGLLRGLLASEAVNELVLEAAAQSVGLTLGAQARGGAGAGGGSAGDRHLLLGFDDVRFAGAAEPGWLLDVAVEIVEAGSAACSARFRVEQGGREIADGRVMVMRAAA